jgi:short-subunit dehydrogenase
MACHARDVRAERRAFPNRYGAWALVAGGSEGLGAAFAGALAERGMNLILTARRKKPLEDLAADLRARFGVQVQCVQGDLATPGFTEELSGAASHLDPGLLVYNAAHAPVGDFAAMRSADLMRVVDVNVRGPIALLRAFLPSMIARKRGAVVLMTSLAGNQGSPSLTAYAASKAFLRVLAEGLWGELKERGIDVIACVAGAVRTPGYAGTAGKDSPGILDPDAVAERALRSLGRGPLVVPGSLNLAVHWLMSRILPRRAAIGVMARSTKDLAGDKEKAGGR